MPLSSGISTSLSTLQTMQTRLNANEQTTGLASLQEDQGAVRLRLSSAGKEAASGLQAVFSENAGVSGMQSMQNAEASASEEAGGMDAGQAAIQRLKDEIERLNKEIQKLKQEIQELRAKGGDHDDEISAKQTQITMLSSQVMELNKQLGKMTGDDNAGLGTSDASEIAHSQLSANIG